MSTRVSVPSWELAPPTPYAAIKWGSPLGPRWGGGGIHTRLRGRRWGDPIPMKAQKLWYAMYTIIPLRSPLSMWKDGWTEWRLPVPSSVRLLCSYGHQRCILRLFRYFLQKRPLQWVALIQNQMIRNPNGMSTQREKGGQRNTVEDW
jgi:hypothetical protein